MLSAVQAPVIKSFRIAAHDTMAPLLSFVLSPVQGAQIFVRDVSNFRDIKSENAALKEEVAKLRSWYHRAMALNHENESLRQLLNMALPPEKKSISARVIIDNSNSYIKSLMIDAGRQNNVREDLAVLSGDGLVGRIIDVGEKTARILTVNDISSRIPVVVEGSGRQAILAGKNSRYPALEHVGPDMRIADGANVLTSGLGDMFPVGLPVGTVFYDPSAADPDLPLVALYVDFESLLYVRMVEKDDDSGLIKSP